MTLFAKIIVFNSNFQQQPKTFQRLIRQLIQQAGLNFLTFYLSISVSFYRPH